MIGGVLQDLRYGLRTLRRQPGLTAVAVLSLGLAIGATATVFTWLNGMVLNPFPAVPAFDRLVVAETRAPEGGTWSVSWPDFRDWRGGARTMDLAAWDVLQVGLRDGSSPTERAWGMPVSGNYFAVLEVPAALGRVLRPDDEAGRAPVAVLGHSYWKRRFGGTSMGLDLHLYVPMTSLPLLMSDGAALLDDRSRRSLSVTGRLRPGATVALAAAELEALALRAGAAGGLERPLGAHVVAHSDFGGHKVMRPVLGALLGVAALVLLIACANVANLLLARAVARRREVAVRLAVGASRFRLIRQLLTESLTLAALAGVFGVLVAFWGRDALLALLPPVPYPIGLNFDLNGPVLAFAVAVTAGAALVFGLAPAVQASKPDLVPTLKDEIGEGHGRRGRLQAALVVGQVALSLVALVSAGLFVRSLAAYRAIDSGMAGLDRVLLVGSDLRLAGLTGDSVQVAVVRRLLAQVRALPGVEAASLARTMPLGPSGFNSSDTRIEGYEPRRDENMHVGHNDVADDYFRTAGIALLEGRGFSDADLAGNAPVVVVNEAFARRFLAGRSPIGARINVGGDWLSIVGVVATTKVEDYTEDPRPVVYHAYSARFGPPEFTLYVRAAAAAGDPLALAPALRRAFAGVSAELPFLDARSMAEYTQLPFFPQKIGATMLAAVGLMALLLAAIGIYGVVAHTVSRRTREIGVRIALGAARRDVLALVVGRSMRLTGLGLAVGLLAALGVGRLLASQLIGISGADPLVFGTISVTLGAVALLASWVPARRAARVDPVIALRSE